jgi:MYXO-CTERM domain-containing protein
VANTGGAKATGGTLAIAATGGAIAATGGAMAATGGITQSAGGNLGNGGTANASGGSNSAMGGSISALGGALAAGGIANTGGTVADSTQTSTGAPSSGGTDTGSCSCRVVGENSSRESGHALLAILGALGLALRRRNRK